MRGQYWAGHVHQMHRILNEHATEDEEDEEVAEDEEDWTHQNRKQTLETHSTVAVHLVPFTFPSLPIVDGAGLIASATFYTTVCPFAIQAAKSLPTLMSCLHST